MLILTRKLDERIIIGGKITIQVCALRGDRVRLGIQAPDGVTIDREEVHIEKIRKKRVQLDKGDK